MSSKYDVEGTLANRKEENTRALVTGYLREFEQSWFNDDLDTLGGLIGAICLQYFNFNQPSHVTVTTNTFGNRTRTLYKHCPKWFNSDVYCRGKRILYWYTGSHPQYKDNAMGAWRIVYRSNNDENFDVANPEALEYGQGQPVRNNCLPEEKYEDDEFSHEEYFLTFFWEYLPQGNIKSYPNI